MSWHQKKRNIFADTSGLKPQLAGKMSQKLFQRFDNFGNPRLWNLTYMFSMTPDTSAMIGGLKVADGHTFFWGKGGAAVEIQLFQRGDIWVQCFTVFLVFRAWETGAFSFGHPIMMLHYDLRLFHHGHSLHSAWYSLAPRNIGTSASLHWRRCGCGAANHRFLTGMLSSWQHDSGVICWCLKNKCGSDGFARTSSFSSTTSLNWWRQVEVWCWDFLVTTDLWSFISKGSQKTQNSNSIQKTVRFRLPWCRSVTYLRLPSSIEHPFN